LKYKLPIIQADLPIPQIIQCNQRSQKMAENNLPCHITDSIEGELAEVT